MKTHVHHFYFIAAILLSGCASHPKEEPIHEQGWIGGEYKCAKSRFTTGDLLFGIDETIASFPPGLERSYKAGILAMRLSTNTPAYLAGLREGDLILELGRNPASDLQAFWNAIRATKPGASMPLKAYRDGKTREIEVIVGREKFRHQGTLMVGLPGPFQSFHPIPTRNAPDFSLVALGWEKNLAAPAELDTVEQRYRRSCHPKQAPEETDEEWHGWLAIFKVTKGRKILAQETVAASQPTAPAR